MNRMWKIERQELMMRTKEFTFYSKHTITNIHCKIWTPQTPKAVVQISHGITEHLGRYEELAERLVLQDIAVIAMDLPGHGQSIRSAKGYFGDWQSVVEDVHTLSIIGHEIFGDIPYIMMGFSLGSFLVRTYAYTYEDYDGLILLGTGNSPLFILQILHKMMEKKSRKIGDRNTDKFVKSLSTDAYNKHFKPTKTDYDWLMKKETERETYLNDPLCYKDVTAGLFRELLFGMIECEKYRNIKHTKDVPILLLSGKDDPVGDFKKGVRHVKTMLDQVGIKRVKVHFVNGRHDILHDEEKEKTIGRILKFMRQYA